MAEPEVDCPLGLWGQHGEFALSSRAWRLCLAFALVFGWQPRGTDPPNPEYVDVDDVLISRWDGRYFPADGQQVSEDDVQALASALERALPDLPDHDLLSEKVESESIRNPWPWQLWHRRARPGTTITSVEEFSGVNKECLRRLITHLRDSGGVWIC